MQYVHQVYVLGHILVDMCTSLIKKWLFGVVLFVHQTKPFGNILFNRFKWVWIPGKFYHRIVVSSCVCNLQVQFRAVYIAAVLSSHSLHRMCVLVFYEINALGL